MNTLDKIICFVNDQRLEVPSEKAFLTLAEFLRYDKGLTGTKVVCAEGDCGACTVLINKATDYKAVNSCIIPMYLLHGTHIITVEGLQKDQDTLHPVQEAMIQCQGTQCGYCTPGFVCAIAGMTDSLKKQNKEITEKRAKNYLTGNLCRCTGYQPILDAATSINTSAVPDLEMLYPNPQRDNECQELRSRPVKINEQIYLPTTLAEALEIKKQKPQIRLLAGSTDVGVIVNKGKIKTPEVMSLYLIDSLRKISFNEKELSIGATATLSQIEDYIEKEIPEFKNLLHIFASPQIKNQGTLVGNVVNASPIGDTLPFLMISDARLVLQSSEGIEEVPLTEFYLGYKTLKLKPDQIVTAIKIPRPLPDAKIKLYKVSLRKDLDISAVTFAGSMLVENGLLKNVRFSLGGVGPVVLRLPQIEKMMEGQKFEKALFEKAANEVPQFINPLSDLRASKEYRLKVAANLFLKYYQELS